MMFTHFFKFGVCSVFLPTEVICFQTETESQDLIERGLKKVRETF